MPCHHALDEFNLCVYRCDSSLKGMLTMREMTDRQIAYHLLFVCVGDNCPCCNWADGDRAVMEGMDLDTAQHIVDTVTEEEDFDRAMEAGGYDPERGDYDDANGEDDRTAFDMSDDADALASAGWGTDEDYGGWGDE